MPTESPRFDRGLPLLQKLSGENPPPLYELAGLVPDLVQQCVAFGYGDVLSRPGLDPKLRQLATVAVLGALGTASSQLAFHVKGARNLGWEPWEILEVAYLLAVFAGFPAALNLAGTVKQTIPEAKGISFPQAEENRRTAGIQALRAISGQAGLQVLDGLQEVFPPLAEAILEFSYGDVLARPGLEASTKELCVVAMLAAKGNAAPQLRIHLRAALQVGCAPSELLELIFQVSVYAGFPAALNATHLANEVFASGL